MYNKKAQASDFLVPSIVRIVAVLAFIITLVIISNNLESFSVDTRKLDSQIITSKILESNCYISEFGLINEEKFLSVSSLDECIENLPNNAFIRVSLDKVSSIYFPSRESFENEARFKELDSSLFDSRIFYPIQIEEDDQNFKKGILEVYIILQ